MNNTLNTTTDNPPNQKQNAYSELKKSSFLGFALEIPSFLMLTVSAFVTASPLIWIDFLDSFCYLLQSSLVCLISGKLQKDNRFSYNYGTDRLETVTALVCNFLMCIGTAGIAVLAVFNLFPPAPQSSFLLYVVFLKIADVLIDGWLLWKQASIRKIKDTSVIKMEFFGVVKDFAFDLLSLLLILACYLYRSSEMTAYFSSAASLVICTVFLVGRIKDIRQNLKDLTDKTLEEDCQFVILKALNRYSSRYCSFYAVNSHRLAGKLLIDFRLGFTPETTYAEMSELRVLLEQELQTQLGNCAVSIVMADESNG